MLCGGCQVVLVTGPRLVGIALASSVVWAAGQVTGAPSSVALPGVPQVSVDAYVAAAASMLPDCGLRWSLVAAIGAVESGHGTFGDSMPDPDTGRVSPPIRGPRLDGEAFARIPDTDDGKLDGDATWDRAVGPMQFIPETWDEYEPFDGADPQNIRDAAKATARLLCAVAINEGRPLTEPDVEEAAIRAYNNDSAYVTSVRAFEMDFAQTAGTGPTAGGKVDARAVAKRLGSEGRARWTALGRYIEAAPGDMLDTGYGLVDPVAGVLWNTLGYDSTDVAAAVNGSEGMVQVSNAGAHITVSASIANQVAHLLDDAEQAGVYLAGSGYRTVDDQRRLRRQNGCPDESSPSDTCATPTAPVVDGRCTSNHCKGLAVDFTDRDGVSLTAGSPEFRWLKANAGRYGLHNLASEPWHWSVDGR